MPTDLQPHARMLNKFRKPCDTGIFYFFPKHLISFSRKKYPWRLTAIYNFSLFIAYLVPMPMVSALVRRARGPEYHFLDISS
jgi:hypothetical protein